MINYLEQQIGDYRQWREQIAVAIADYREWLDLTGASDAMQDIALDVYGKRHLDGVIEPLFEPSFWTTVKGLLPTGFGFYLLALALSGMLLPISRTAGLRGFALAAQFLCDLVTAKHLVALLALSVTPSSVHFLGAFTVGCLRLTHLVALGAARLNSFGPLRTLVITFS